MTMSLLLFHCFEKFDLLKSNSFRAQRDLEIVYFNHNLISIIEGRAFVEKDKLHHLRLGDNRLGKFNSDVFQGAENIRQLDLGENFINELPTVALKSLVNLLYLNLSANSVQSLGNNDLASFTDLYHLDLSGDNIANIVPGTFLGLKHFRKYRQNIDLRYHKLERLGERTFEDLIRLESLNLEGNFLSDLPEFAFERARLQMLENVNLAKNSFEIAPLRSLRKPFFFLSSVNLSSNKIVEIAGDNSVMINIKHLDLSFNPLSGEAISNVLSEPKTIRHLNLAGTNVQKLTQLKTPFLNTLNLSFNNISEIPVKVFERATLLERLDISNNRVGDASNFPNIWESLLNLQSLNVSGNPIEVVSQNDFQGLESLKTLTMNDLTEVNRLEKTAFKSVPNLISLDAYNYPKLGYLDVQGLLINLLALERVNIKLKYAGITGDQLQNVLHSRLRELGLFGSRLNTLSLGSFSRLNVLIRLRNTSITTLPQTLFFPVSRSSMISLNVIGSQLTTQNGVKLKCRWLMCILNK